MSYYRSVHFLCFITVYTYVLLGGGINPSFRCAHHVLCAELQLTLLFLNCLFVVYVFLGTCPLHLGCLIVAL